MFFSRCKLVIIKIKEEKYVKIEGSIDFLKKK